MVTLEVCLRRVGGRGVGLRRRGGDSRQDDTAGPSAEWCPGEVGSLVGICGLEGPR